MKEESNSRLLDREEATRHARAFFQPQIDLFEDLVNYGTHLVLRAYASSQRNVADAVVCGVLLKQIVSMLDSVQVLLAAGTVHPAFLPARAAWEASLYIHYILAESSNDRARAYLVANYREERSWLLKATKGTPEATEFERIQAEMGLDVYANRPELLAEAAKRLVDIDRHLNRPELKPMNDAYTAARGRKKRDPEWYVVLGVPTIKALAERLGRASEYMAFYSKGSKVTHSASMNDHVKVKGGGVGEFRHIREFRDVHLLVSFTAGTAIATFRRVLTFYRAGEVPQLDRKYIDEWRSAFLSVPRVQE